MTPNYENAALLVMDVEPGIIDRIENKEQYLEKVRAAIEVARGKAIPVIYVVVGFRPGFPEINIDNRIFGPVKKNAPATMVNPHPALEVAENEVVVTKRRVSAFTGSDLEVLLRAGNIRHLLLAGIATSGVVLSTTREAADKDYRITIFSDLCADPDEEVHRVLVEKVFPKQAEVMTSVEWGRGLHSI